MLTSLLACRTLDKVKDDGLHDPCSLYQPQEYHTLDSDASPLYALDEKLQSHCQLCYTRVARWAVQFG